MATLEELRYWCFGGERPAEGGEKLPDALIFRAMAYRFDPERYAEFRDDYRRASMIELPLSVELKRVAKAFREAKVRFAPVKGADLAESCYPDPAVRVRCDIDLLVHPDDVELAVRIARNGGWNSRHQYRHEHHCPSMYKKNAMLELHFGLPGFPERRTPEIWKLLVVRDGTEFRLPPELSLLVVFQHGRSHRWINGAALIADYAFLLKAHPGFDWALARKYAEIFDAADPAVVCFALPELFPPESMPPEPAPPEELRGLLREALLTPVNFQEHQEDDVMNRGDRFGRAWWKERVRGFSPSSVRIGYGLPDDAGFWRMTAAYLRMCGDKTVLALRGMFGRDGEVTRALRRAERIEKGLSGLRK